MVDLIKNHKNRQSLFALALSIFVLATIFLFSQPTWAVGSGSSTVSATLCDNQPPEILVTSPQSDSTVNTPTVTLSGTTIRTTQINVTDNGNPVQSIAVGQNNSFNTTLSLLEGTNTLVLDAYFSCNQTHASTTIVVTYSPAVVVGPHPSTNVNTGTSTSTNSGAGIFNNNPTSVSNPDFTIIHSPGKPTAPPKQSIIDRVGQNLGLQPSAHDSFTKPIYSWLSVLVIIVAIAVFIIPTQIVGWLVSVIYGANAKPKAWMLSKKIIRIIAVVVAIVFGIIVQL